MTKKSEQKPFPLWAKILIGIFGVGVVSTGMLIALNVATSEKEITSSSTTEQELENSDLSSITSTGMNTQQAIKDYLTAANTDIQKEKVTTGDKIIVDYIGRLNDQEVFDTSVKTVAEAAGKYSPQRNYDEGLSFTVGAGQMIKGFDEAVVGMKVGETKTVHIPAEKAYGARRDDLIVRVPLKEAGDTSGAKVGMQVVL